MKMGDDGIGLDKSPGLGWDIEGRTRFIFVICIGVWFLEPLDPVLGEEIPPALIIPVLMIEAKGQERLVLRNFPLPL